MNEINRKQLSGPHELRGIHRYLDIAYRTIFGFDYFISYTWRDINDPDQRYIAECARHYAVKLRDALRQQQFVCFLDSDDYAKGQNWRWFGQRALKGTSRLILVLSPAVSESQAVLDEVEYFKTTGKAIVPLEFVDCPPQGNTSRLLSLIETEILRIREPAVALKDGPSAYAIGELVKTFNLTRQNVLRRRIMWATIAILVFLLLGVGSLGYVAAIERNDAKTNLALTKLQLGQMALDSGDSSKALHYWAQSVADAPPNASARLSLTQCIGALSPFIRATYPQPSLAWSAAMSHEDGMVITGVGEFAFSASPSVQNEFQGSQTGEAWLWNARNNERLKATLKPGGIVKSVAISNDGKRLLTVNEKAGTDAMEVQLWDAESGDPKGTLPHSRAIESAIFGPDGSTVLTACRNEIQLWSSTSCKRSATIPLTTDAFIPAVAFSSNGSQVLVGCGSKACLFDSLTGVPVGQEWDCNGRVWAVAFSPEGPVALVNINDNEVRVVDAIGGAPRGNSMIHEGKVRCVAFNHDGTLLLTGSGKTVQLWNTRTGQALGFRLHHESEISFATFSNDGSTILTGAHKIVRLWTSPQRDRRLGYLCSQPMWHLDITDKRQYASAELSETGFMAPNLTRFNPDGSRIVTGSIGRSRRRIARLWNVRSGELIASTDKLKTAISAIGISSNGSGIMAASRDGEIGVWEAGNSKRAGRAVDAQHKVRAAALSPDGTTIATGYGEEPDDDKGYADVTGAWSKLWNSRTGQLLQTIRHYGKVNAVAFSPNGKTVITGGKDRLAQMWDSTTGESRGAPMPHYDDVTSVLFSPKGNTVATASMDNCLRVWNATTGALLSGPMGHDKEIRVMVFSPDENVIATGGSDHTARLWNVRTGRQIGLSMKHDDVLTSVAFSGDCSTVVTGSSDQTVRLWNAKTATAVGLPIFFENEDEVEAVNVTEDFVTVLTSRTDFSARIWQLTAPAIDDRMHPRRLPLSVEVRTASRLNPKGEVEFLTFAEWMQRRDELDAMGGPSDAPSWMQYKMSRGR